MPSVTATLPTVAEMDMHPEVAEGDVVSLVEGNTAFALELYSQLTRSGGNLFYSPYSLSQAIAMAYAGAGGETQAQMADTLRFDLPQGRLHTAFNALDVLLTGQTWEEEGAVFLLNVAISVWAQEGYGFLPDYLDTLTLNYGEEVRLADFRRDAEGARGRINDWIADETEDRIRDTITSGAVDEFTRLVLANAIYFKAAWENAFDERATTDLAFHLLDGSKRDVPMMRREADLLYASGEGYQAIDLPYKGGDVAMTILLPKSGRFSEFEESLSGDSVEAILDGLDYELVRLTMPKFAIESAFSLSDTLSAMGMPDAFDDEAANFSGMDGQTCKEKGDICLLISDVLHKAFISVDEAGTEAAAATAVIAGATLEAEVEPEPIRLVVDRPFLFIIRHQATGAVLFVGRVLDP